LLVLAVGALGMTFMSYPLAAFSLSDFLLCFLIPVPGLLFAAALGVLMEALLPRHRSWANGMGLVILLALWIVSLLPLALDRQGVPAPYCFLDIGGTAALCDQVYSSVRAVLGHDPTSVMILAGMEDVSQNAGLPVATLGLSAPDGLFWVSRVVVVCAAALLVLLATAVWRRREPSYAKAPRAKGVPDGIMSGSASESVAGSTSTVGLAAAIFSPWMNISGSILANFWRRRPPPSQP
jgi:hypothetical protein